MDKLGRLLLVGNLSQLLEGLLDILERLSILKHLVLREEFHVFNHLFHALLHLVALQLNPHRLLEPLRPRGVLSRYGPIENIFHLRSSLLIPF